MPTGNGSRLDRDADTDSGSGVIDQTSEHSPLGLLAAASLMLPGPTNPPLGNETRPEGTTLTLLFLLENFGAGEGIRTLDPNLGKVVLYP
jgi:hypothetical protein